MWKRIANILKQPWPWFGVALIVMAGWWFLRPQAPQLATTLEKVSRHMVLPANETPTMAVVEDRTKLQSSLKKVAETNDVVLVYTKAGYVVVYRPTLDKIVSVQPILSGTQGNANLNVTVAVFNGSGSEAKLAAFIKKLYGAYPNVRLVAKEAAPRTFPSTIVYGASAQSSLVAQIAEGMNMKQGITPEGLSEKAADISFVVGEDFTE